MITFYFNGEPIRAHSGQSVAAALLLNQRRITRLTRKEGKPRGVFCGIGICFDCLVVVDGKSSQRSCITEISEGMKIEVQDGN